jgi:hypothetical protein
VLKIRNLLIFQDAQNVENGKIAPNWNVSGTRNFRRLANLVASQGDDPVRFGGYCAVRVRFPNVTTIPMTSRYREATRTILPTCGGLRGCDAHSSGGALRANSSVGLDRASLRGGFGYIVGYSSK